MHTVDLNISESITTSVLFDPNGSIVLGGSSRAADVAIGIPPAIEQSLECEDKHSVWAGSSGHYSDLLYKRCR